MHSNVLNACCFDFAFTKQRIRFYWTCCSLISGTASIFWWRQSGWTVSSGRITDEVAQLRLQLTNFAHFALPRCVALPENKIEALRFGKLFLILSVPNKNEDLFLFFLVIKFCKMTFLFAVSSWKQTRKSFSGDQIFKTTGDCDWQQRGFVALCPSPCWAPKSNTFVSK